MNAQTLSPELRDRARETGSKAYDSYAKATRSISSCPVVYNHPRELMALAGVGVKTVQILETKWKKHCEENGIPIQSTPPSTSFPLPLNQALTSERTVQRKKSTKTKSTFAWDDPSLDDGTGSEADSPAPPPAKKAKKTQTPKTYIPQKGSGAYGILLGLVLAIERPELNTQVFLTKSELVRAAQPFSDSSYEHSEKGSYFTAWNSMKSLITKGYVYMTGNPHKYCLTEDG